jgi:hypothetical protein
VKLCPPFTIVAMSMSLNKLLTIGVVGDKSKSCGKGLSSSTRTNNACSVMAFAATQLLFPHAVMSSQMSIVTDLFGLDPIIHASQADNLPS